MNTLILIAFYKSIASLLAMHGGSTCNLSYLGSGDRRIVICGHPRQKITRPYLKKTS
jgi:hypothetical protein